MISGILQPAIFLNQKKFKVVSQIGEGGFAFVYQVRSVNKTDRNELYAIKKMICQSEEQLSLARKEIEVLTKLDHKNVMPLLDSSYGTNKYDQEEFLLLFPLFKCSVQTIIDKGKGFPQCGFSTGADVVKVLRQSAQGLAAIHAGGYRHADIKPGNVLINANFDAVITDFGSVSPIREVINNHSEALIVQERAADYSTASYRAPELLMTPNDCVIDGKADIWSFGCLMFAMIFSRTPFETPQEGLSTLAILSANYSCPDKHIWPMEYLDLIRDCLKVPTTGRLDITELIERLDTLCDAPNDLTAPAEEASVDDTESGSIHSTDPSITQLPIPISFGGDHPVSEEKNSEATCIPIQSNPTTALADSSNHVDDHGMDPANVSASGMDANHAITKDSSLIHLAIDSKQDNFSSGTASLCNSPTNQNQGIEDNYYKVGNDFANFENMPAPELLVIQEDNIFDVEASESIEFGEFTAVEMPSLEEEESKVKSSIALKSSSVTQREVCEVDLHAIIEAQAASIGGIVKQSKVWLMRLGGFPKKMAKKQVSGETIKVSIRD